MKIKGLHFTIFCLLFCLNCLFSQTINLTDQQVLPESPLNKIFVEYYLVKIDFNQLKSAMSSRGNQHFLTLKHKDFEWNLELFDNDIYTSDYLLQVASDNGIEKLRRKPAIHSVVGYLKTARGGQARMTIADNFIAGMVESGGASYFIEPANGLDPKLPNNYLVVYNSDHIFANNNVECGYEMYIKNKQQLTEESKEIEVNRRSHCLQVEIAISNDYPVFQKRGSVTNVENWNNTILTLLQANYDDEFEHGLEFVQSASFVATSAASDPWNGINNINAHLDKHVMWGNNGGYGASYDVATAWTTKYTSGAVGLAWLGVICNNLRYNVCSDYGGANNCIKQLQAHELGHNFNANHDGSGQPYIMAPAVNCSNAWSSASVSAVNAHVNTRGCLSVCSSGSPPSADFFGAPVEGCIPLVVNFTDLSTNDPTAWLWTFPGGTPSTSTLQNPTVTYKSYGSFDVTLKASNSYGNNSVTFSKYIITNDKPVASFTKVVIERFAYFTSTSKYASIYNWDFGDGDGSTDESPTHEYQNDGVYDVVLTVENDCGIHQTSMKVTIVTIPVALFIADTTKGCNAFKVKYINLSSKNVTTWTWTFPGGTPSSSSLFEPEVVYKNPGVFDVKLVAANSKYKSTSEKLKYITADTIPISAYTVNINKDTVHFNNFSKYAKSILWDFGDGSTSTELNPSHVFYPGSYVAKLIAYSVCGTDTSFQNIVIGGGLSAGFTINQDKGCIPFVVQFTNTSSGANTYKWTFPGGNPSSSTEVNPKITYNNVGVFDVSLEASNATDTKTFSRAAVIKTDDKPKANYTTSVSGYTVFFTDQSNYGSTYNWDFGDQSTSSSKSPSHVYAVEGEYKVKLTIENDCGLDTLEKTVAVFLIPKVDFTADTTLICGSGIVKFKSKTSSDVHSWLWQFDGGKPDTSSLKDPIVTYEAKGTHTVKLVVKNSNGENILIKQSFIKVISPVLCPENIFYKNDILNSSDIEPLKRQLTSDVVVFPNPTNGQLKLFGNSHCEITEIKIMDLFGKTVFNELIQSESGYIKSELDLSHLSMGSYYLNIKDKDRSITKAIFISK